MFINYDKYHLYVRSILFILIFFIVKVFAQQINIPRIEMIPNHPSPYQMRDWKKTALGYDSLVFDLNAEGDYLPLIWTGEAGINYPENPNFGLHSYVGTDDPAQGEAINVIPAVVGASLLGIDKSEQNGKNWVLMCADFFNKQNGENVYLNNHSAHSGGDWWYDTMPNVFFYQLYSFYPNTSQFNFQFQSVADRWLDAIRTMGGKTTPWKIPNMNYWAWDLIDMKPVTREIKQPEAAGALAWIEYMAFIETGDEQYRIGSEWAMEFLNKVSTNPAYELQLPYGVYTAARMNAEMGTTYNVEKLLNWCFTPDGNIRQWGMTLGNWGGYDCYGLIGEALYDGYAFAMNGFEQMGALLPMVRYDDRFARAVGKWALHCANASRLFYSNYLPDFNQDSENWAHTYDPNSYIGYESLREEEPFSATSPFATGDAKKGGWAATNLGLYGSSHVGILGALIDTTNVSQILKYDLLKTDYFGKDANPSFLFFNPYGNDTSIVIALPEGTFDIYDAVSNAFLSLSESGSAEISIPADGAVLAVLTPPGGAEDYSENRLYINGVVVDYNAGESVANYRPRIKALAAGKEIVSKNETISIYCTATDREDTDLQYAWWAANGSIDGEGSSIQWTAPSAGGTCDISCIVTDRQAASDSGQISIEVISNNPPQISKLVAQPSEVLPGDDVNLSCEAFDIDGDSLNITWQIDSGSEIGTGSELTWQAPQAEGLYQIYCIVQDTYGSEVRDSVAVVVGDLVLHYTFSGNAYDSSSFGNNGFVSGAALSPDRYGVSEKAYFFDGQNDNIRATNTPTLNFQHEITVSFWMKIDQFYDREAYPISHGNWQNRWKISITNKKIRWTVNTLDGIKDLDSNLELQLGVFYLVTCTYSGADYQIFINGALDNSTTHSGLIRQTTIDLTIGQTLPNEQQYNFNGILDDIRIYNRAMSTQEIKDLYSFYTSLESGRNNLIPQSTYLFQNYPNPFNPSTIVKFNLEKSSRITIDIFDCTGEKIQTLLDGIEPSGIHELKWDAVNQASGIYFIRLKSTSYMQTRKCVKLK
jgi:hypothetical protein